MARFVIENGEETGPIIKLSLRYGDSGGVILEAEDHNEETWMILQIINGEIRLFEFVDCEGFQTDEKQNDTVKISNLIGED